MYSVSLVLRLVFIYAVFKKFVRATCEPKRLHKPLKDPVPKMMNHALKSKCFGLKETMAKANMVCPFCKKRFSTWSRKATKDKTLVDKELWELIQKEFPDQVKLRMDGEFIYFMYVLVPIVVNCGRND